MKEGESIHGGDDGDDNDDVDNVDDVESVWMDRCFMKQTALERQCDLLCSVILDEMFSLVLSL